MTRNTTDRQSRAVFAGIDYHKKMSVVTLGDKDGTLEVLDQMVPMGPTRIGRDFLISPNFAFLRGDPRLKALRKKVGLPA